MGISWEYHGNHGKIIEVTSNHEDVGRVMERGISLGYRIV
jgi:hypothetical protein